MRKLLTLAGATLGGWIGWYVGSPLGIFGSFIVGMIGTGFGMYAGIRFAQRYW